jgi:predicted CXXCH cytochrome family protein
MRSAIALLLAALAAAPGGALAQASKQKLKPGAGGAGCLECHVKFGDVLKKTAVHTPVRQRQCTGCHNPHASDHAKLLTADGSTSCLACHATIVPKDAKSVHRPASETRCLECHDPHSSAIPAILVKPVDTLCAGCHKPIAEGIAKAKRKHAPVEKGCVTCHDPHGSATSANVLKKPVPALCIQCHKTDKPIFTKQHFGYDVARSDCTSCHDPHGSSKPGILYDEVHSPVAKGMCAQCHDAPGSANALRTKERGPQLCAGCHGQKVNDMLARNRVHSPVLEGQACLTCHAPHAAKGKGLMRGSTIAVCGSCHSDTLKRLAASPTKHQPIADGECGKCHDPHSGNASLMLTSASTVEMCGKCHDWLNHSSHPMGDKAKDPRNRNLTVQCMSCHRAHGTEYKRMLLSASQLELCVTCHKQYQR